MALHLARSDGSEGSRKKCDDQKVLPIIVIEIADQPVMRGWEGKVESFFTHQGFFLLFRQTSGGKNEYDEQQQIQPRQREFASHDNLLSIPFRKIIPQFSRFCNPAS